MPVRPICLPHSPKGSPLAGSEVLASGWGSLSHSRLGGPEEFPDELHSVRLRVMSKDECKNILQKSKISQHWTPNLICTLGENRGPCKGDSGGPIAQKQGNQYILVQTFIELKLVIFLLTWISFDCCKGFNDCLLIPGWLGWYPGDLRIAQRTENLQWPETCLGFYLGFTRWWNEGSNLDLMTGHRWMQSSMLVVLSIWVQAIFRLCPFAYIPFFQVRNGNLPRNQSQPILKGEYFQ